MKNKINTLLLAAITALAGNMMLGACSEEKLGASIFDTTDYPLDRTVYTFPLDTFVKKNFLEPYNLKFIYKMEDIGSDMQKNLVPADYDKSVKLAVLTKYLWLDIYKKVAGEEFLKINCPRIIHVIGSPGYLSDGSRELGVAEGGLKVTLMEVNRLNENNMDGLNDLFFHTMHHEFGHILNQTAERPVAFNLLSNALYDAAGWAEKHDSVQAALGFTTPYGSSQVGEDWVETLACYVTWDSTRWEQLLNTASFDWEEIDMTSEEFAKFNRPGCDRDTVGYLRQMANGDYKVVRKVVDRNADGYVAKDKDGNWHFADNADGVDGREIILQKVKYVQQWLMENWQIDLDVLRKEVQTRQFMTDSDGRFLRDAYGRYVNRLTQPVAEDSNVTLIQQLLEEVEQYKTLQAK